MVIALRRVGFFIWWVFHSFYFVVVMIFIKTFVICGSSFFTYFFLFGVSGYFKSYWVSGILGMLCGHSQGSRVNVFLRPQKGA
jgi:hypothetical protein